MNTPPSFRPGRLPGFLRICVRHMHNRRPKLPTTGFQGPEAHGEKLWVFTHRKTAQVIYSLKNTLDGFHDLKQLPFNGKKTKPAKLRKDYWSPMATIEFGPGKGPIGRSVFQKLRELKHLHEVNWPDEFRFKTPDDFRSEDKRRAKEAEEKGKVYRPMRNRRERGVALNAQKTNAIADMAVVLAGQGRGNRIVTSEAEQGPQELLDVTVQWANDQDRNFAEEWSANVAHELFETHAYSITDVDEPLPEARIETEATQPDAEVQTEEKQPDAEVKTEEVKTEEVKTEEKQVQKDAQ